MGGLIFGSGAISANAAFSNSVNADNNMQILAAIDIDVLKGDNVPTDDTVTTITDPNGHSLDILNLDQSTDSRVSSGSLDFADLTPSDVPVAGVNDGQNGSLIIETATPIRPNDSSPIVWQDLIELRNEGDATVSGVGITFSTYGSGVGNGNISQEDVQDIYRFIEKSSSTLISPTKGDASEDPANTIGLSAGESEQLNVEDHAHDYTGALQSESSATGDPWSGSYDTVSLLDQVTVGSNWA